MAGTQIPTLYLTTNCFVLLIASDRFVRQHTYTSANLSRSACMLCTNYIPSTGALTAWGYSSVVVSTFLFPATQTIEKPQLVRPTFALLNIFTLPPSPPKKRMISKYKKHGHNNNNNKSMQKKMAPALPSGGVREGQARPLTPATKAGCGTNLRAGTTTKNSPQRSLLLLPAPASPT